MKVICAGLAKTGTTSLAKALQVLGYNVYDFDEHLTFHRQQWLDSFETDRLPDFVNMYKGVDAVTDVPPAFWFEEISSAFPDAKVVLTVRDTEEAWLRSWIEHLGLIDTMPFYVKIYLSIAPSGRRGWHFIKRLHEAIYGTDNPKATALFRVKYRQHNERVQAVMPRDKLLVFNVKQGWEPLCKFLGCDVPSVPFPRVNVAHSDTKKVASEKFEPPAKLVTFLLFVLIILAGILIMFLLH